MTSTASRPSQRFSLNFPTLWENTPQSSLSAHLANWIVLETAGLAIGAYIADNIKIAIKSQHTGHFRLATCPSQFTSAAARWQQPLLFLCFALHRVHNLHRPAHPTCLSFPLYPPPFSSGGNKGVESCADATGVLGIFVHQLLLMLARSQPTGRSDCEPATGNPVPRSRGHLPRPEGCHY